MINIVKLAIIILLVVLLFICWPKKIGNTDYEEGFVDGVNSCIVIYLKGKEVKNGD